MECSTEENKKREAKKRLILLVETDFAGTASLTGTADLEAQLIEAQLIVEAVREVLNLAC
jgi:hypothetical protein